MLELVAFWGFLGGLIWAGAGFLSHGRPGKKGIPPVLVIAGFLGIVSAFAVFYFDISLLSLAFWKIAAVAALIGYVGADILDSLFEILEKYGRPKLKTEGGKEFECGKSHLRSEIRLPAKSGGMRC